MSLKDEINRLILEKRQFLEREDTKNLEFHELQKRRFAVLRPTLDELAQATDPAYLRVKLMDTEAKLQLGTTHGEHFKVQTEWRAAPSSGVRFELDSPGGMLMVDKPGFTLEEVTEHEYPDYDRSEQNYTFKTEGELIEHIVKRTTELIAHHQHIEEQFREHRAQRPIT